MPRPLRLLHTSDLHLGDGSASAQKALVAVIDAGLQVDAHALCIAGDLFDHNRVPDEEIVAFLAQVRRFARPVIVLPGNHDCYDGSSVYHRAPFRAAPPNFHLLIGSDEGPLYFPDLELEVWGQPVVDHHPGFHPLQRVPPRRNSGWYVVLAHGHLVEGPGDLIRSSPVLPEEIASAPCDYIALGHWEGFRQVAHRPVPAFYSGSPRLRAFGEPSSVVLVTLAEEGLRIERHPLDF